MTPPLPQLTVSIFASCNPRCFELLPEPARSAIEGVKAESLHHVFPTVSTDDGTLGLMVGVAAAAAPEGAPWQLSDAFGRMGYDDEKASPLNLLLGDVEQAWHLQEGTYLPIRWLTPLKFELITPVHLDLIDGRSLQVPLLVALLRAACSPHDPEKMPWGAGPVFCTGEIAEGQFHYVNHVAAKLEGFIREFGEDRVALLTKTQWSELPEALRAQVRPEFADSLAELLALPPMREGLHALVNTPPDLDRHLAIMESRDRRQHFDKVGALIAWMTRHVTEAQPYYFVRIRLRESALHAHEGRFAEARAHLERAAKLADSVADQIGIDLHIAMLTRGASIWLDMGRPEIPVVALERLRADMRHVSPRERAAYWGTLCQHYRALGRHDKAIDAGERAVEAARFGCVNELFRDLNYLAHAHIARARVSEAHRAADLARASEYLDRSEGPEGPPAGSRNQQSNRLFCEHLRLEIARVNGVSVGWREDIDKVKFEIWEHPVLFSMLSLVRNRAIADREALAVRLLAVSQGFLSKNSKHVSVFQLFNAVYALYVAAVIRKEVDFSTTRLRAVLDDFATTGADAWRARLALLLEQIEKAPQNFEVFEALCDAVYYH